MSSEAKIAANRRNATKSTGPRTTAGKARSRRNAFRHGLATPVCSDPAVADQVTVLANAFLSPSLAGNSPQAALAAAEAQLEIMRVRQTRTAILKGRTRAIANENTDENARALAFAQEAPLLSAFDRYENRALSRRNRALRKLGVR